MPMQEIDIGNDRLLQDIADLLVPSHKIVVITGAGISTSCGIPDFRSKDGLYNMVPERSLPTPPPSEPSTPSRKRKASELEDETTPPSSQSSTTSTAGQRSSPASRLRGQDLFDARVWARPETAAVFYRFVASLRQTIENEVTNTSLTHKFLRTLRDGGRLMRCYTQNIDGLEAREGLEMDMARGRGNKRRFMRKNLQAPRPVQTHETDFDGGCEVVQLHGELQTLRCTLCQDLQDWDTEATALLLDGEAPGCEKCIAKNDEREAKGKRGVSVGLLRPNIVLYGEEHPSNQLLAPFVPFDISSDPEILIIMGTSLKVFGLQKVVKDFAKQIHSRKDGKGKVIFVNRTKPAESVWDDVIDSYVAMDCDDWVCDLRKRREDLWLHQGALDLKITKPVKRKRKDNDSGDRPTKKMKGKMETMVSVDIPKKRNQTSGGPVGPPAAVAREGDQATVLAPGSLEVQTGIPQPSRIPSTPKRARIWKRTSLNHPVALLRTPKTPKYSPLRKSFKPVSLGAGVPPGTPAQPQFSPLNTPCNRKRLVEIYADVEIADSDEERRNRLDDHEALAIGTPSTSRTRVPLAEHQLNRMRGATGGPKSH